MVTIIIFIIVALFFLWLIIFSALMPKIMRKQGRHVDARVVSCETANISILNTRMNALCYSVTVDFYGLSGETIVKTIQSEKSYAVGDVVRSIYIDKKDHLLFDEEKPIVKVSGDTVTILVIVGMLLIGIAAMVMEITDNEALHEMLSYGIGYGMGILFAAYGIYEIIRYIQESRDKINIQVIMGTQVSYEKELSRPESTFIYYPIYEYMVSGERCLYRSQVAGNSKKYKKIGRQVHIEKNVMTGEVSCREDKKTALGLYIILALVGVAAICFMTFQTISVL